MKVDPPGFVFWDGEQYTPSGRVSGIEEVYNSHERPRTPSKEAELEAMNPEILAVNPGSTSTKIAWFSGEER